MRKNFCLVLLSICMTTVLHAADTVYVHNPQIPILIDREDNVLFQIRVPNAQKGDVLSQFTLSFGKDVNLSEIKALRLFYAGTEAISRKGLHFSPEVYISSHNVKNTHSANLSYSVMQNELVVSEHSVSFMTSQPMMKGINYFWVSIEMNSDASLFSRVTVRAAKAMINSQLAVLAGEKDEKVRRLGIGVRHAGDDGSVAYRIPGLVTTNEGTLLGVYDVRYNSSIDLQERVDIGLSRSIDKGKTWEPMRIAMSFGEAGGLPAAQNGVGDPCILVDKKTNTVWVVAVWAHGMGNERMWWNSMPGMAADETAQLMLTKSVDDGKTWSKPINITEQLKDSSWYLLLQGPGRGITTNYGTLVFPIQFIDSMRVPHSGIMYSTDRGNTWKISNAARSNTTESQVAELPNGSLMLNMRDNRGGSRAVYVTRDFGKTWIEHISSRKVLPESVCMASLISVHAADNILGKDLLLFSNPNTTENRNHITLKASLDGGETWPAEYQLLLDEEESWGYSCLTMIDKETVGILYESSVAHITFQAVKLKDLIH